MKTIFKIGVLLGLIMASLATLATGNLSVNLTTVDETKALVEIKNDYDLNYEIKIYNSEGERIYRHKTAKASSEFVRPIDLSDLDHGWYKMEVNTDGAKFVKHLIVNNSGVRLTKSTKQTEPFFALKNNTIVVSHLNHAQNDVRLLLYQNGQLLVEKELENKFAINYGVDISKLDSGNYQLILVSGDDSFNFEVKK
ncbi:MAG: hypothetical protein JNK09_13315 [Prolixibacteraceae bacterium]|nr:hypothetical protein [Prolixibacteraceae bacterium]